MNHPTPTPPKWERGIILSVIGAAVVYLVMVIWSGADQVWQALETIPVWLLPSLAGLIFFTYILRFIRWQWYLAVMGHSIPARNSFQIFLASFALAASPGKAGESIKALLLKQRWNVPFSQGVAALFCERFTDALSVVVLICLSVFTLAEAKWAIAIVGTLQIGLIVLLQYPKFIKRYCLHPLGRWSKLRPIMATLETAIDSTSLLLQPRLLLGSLVLGMVAWGLEGIGLFTLFQHLGDVNVTPYQAVIIHNSAGLLGALSMVPGGIGSTEAIGLSLALIYGATKTMAVTAIFLIRLLTLWFAIAIGIVALLTFQRRS